MAGGGLQDMWLANEPGQRGAVGVYLTQIDQHATELTQCHNLHVMILSSVFNIRMCYSKQTIKQLVYTI